MPCHSISEYIYVLWRQDWPPLPLKNYYFAMRRVAFALRNGGEEGRRLASDSVSWQWMTENRALLGVQVRHIDDRVDGLSQSVFRLTFGMIVAALGGVTSAGADALFSAFFFPSSPVTGSAPNQCRWWRMSSRMSVCMRVTAIRASRTFAVPLRILRNRFPEGLVRISGHNDPFTRRLRRRDTTPQSLEVREIWRKYWAVGDELYAQYQAQSWLARRHERTSDTRTHQDMRAVMVCLWPMYYEWRAQETKAICEYELFDGSLRLVYDAWA
jgi:hypothetical protein